jgi:ubiquinone/menaquinone biosynthesis C-methylase UbiE
MKPVFDAYGDSYNDVMKKSIGFIGQNHDYYTSAKADCIRDVLQRQFGDTKNLHVLDVGCGIGKTDRFLFSKFGKLSGTDISSACIECARQENPQVQYEVYDGRTLPFENESVDAAFLICVLHHVIPAERDALLREVRRVLKPGGVLFVFEHNPFNPLTRLAVARCEFDRDANLLSRRLSSYLLEKAGTPVFEQRYILFSPFRLKWFSRIEKSLRHFAAGAQYYVAGRKP